MDIGELYRISYVMHYMNLEFHKKFDTVEDLRVPIIDFANSYKTVNHLTSVYYNNFTIAGFFGHVGIRKGDVVSYDGIAKEYNDKIIILDRIRKPNYDWFYIIKNRHIAFRFAYGELNYITNLTPWIFSKHESDLYRVNKYILNHCVVIRDNIKEDVAISKDFNNYNIKENVKTFVDNIFLDSNFRTLNNILENKIYCVRNDVDHKLCRNILIGYSFLNNIKRISDIEIDDNMKEILSKMIKY